MIWLQSCFPGSKPQCIDFSKILSRPTWFAVYAFLRLPELHYKQWQPFAMAACGIIHTLSLLHYQKKGDDSGKARF